MQPSETAPRNVYPGHGRREPVVSADLVTVALLAVAPVLRLALLTGPIGSDDVNYFHFAQQLLHSQHIDELHHHGGRLFFVILAGIPAVLTGSIAAGAVASVAFASMRDILVTMFVRGRVGPFGAAMAAGVLSVNALSAAYSGLLTPDPLVSLIMFASALLVFLATDGEHRRRHKLVLASGALAAVGYSVKDTGILAVVPAVVWLTTGGRIPIAQRLRLLAGYAAAFAVVSSIEMAAFWLLSGDALYRFHAIGTVYNVIMGESPDLYSFLRSGFWNLTLVTLPETATLPVLVLAAAVWSYSLARRDGLFFFAASGTFLGLFLIFGSSSLTRLVPLPVQDRYFEPLIPFLAVSVGALAARLFSDTRFRIPGVPIAFAAGLAAVSMPSVIFNAGDITFSALGKNTAIAINAMKRTHPELPISLSPNMLYAIEPFVAPVTYRSLRTIPSSRPLAGGLYVLHPWKDIPGPGEPWADVVSLPIALVVNEDQRILSRLRPVRAGPDASATVYVMR